MRIAWINRIYNQQYLVGGLEHEIYVSIIYVNNDPN